MAALDAAPLRPVVAELRHNKRLNSTGPWSRTVYALLSLLFFVVRDDSKYAKPVIQFHFAKCRGKPLALVYYLPILC
jgi:hypothetical protein